MPIGKCLILVVVIVDYSICDRNTSVAITFNRYLLMTGIALETVLRTGVITFFYLVSSGWNTVRFELHGARDASRVTKCMGLAYLTHSAYLVTVD